MLTEIAAIASFLIMRLGLPIAGILGLSYLAYRWLNQGAAPAMPGPGFIPIADTGPRCWDERHCTPQMKASCPAHQRPHIPCWLAVQLAEGHVRAGCADCRFYQAAVAA